ncbi:MAG: hypothetical protein ACTSVC_06390 [Promethearchaeota archaeon]
MFVKKMICPICKTKSALYEPKLGKYKCHICGHEFEEKKITIIGNFNIKKSKDQLGINYIEIICDERTLTIKKDGEKAYIKIKEET